MLKSKISLFLLKIEAYYEIIKDLILEKTPIFEPDLDNLLNTAVKNKKIIFTDERSTILAADIVWITFDTPVDENDIADVNLIYNEITQLFPYLSLWL